VAVQDKLIISSHGRGTTEISAEVSQFVRNSGINAGICQLFCQHTSASLIICENADPSVQHDLETHMSGLVVDGDPRFTHTLEGDDDMPAHIRTILTNPNLSVPIHKGELALGMWQGIFLWEHRLSAQQRSIIITILS